MSVERFAFTQLIKGVRDGWEVPDDVLKAGIATAHAITKSAGASPRDKARAAELLIGAAFRQKEHLLAVAKIEHEIVALEAQNDAFERRESFPFHCFSPAAHLQPAFDAAQKLLPLIVFTTNFIEFGGLK